MSTSDSDIYLLDQVFCENDPFVLLSKLLAVEQRVQLCSWVSLKPIGVVLLQSTPGVFLFWNARIKIKAINEQFVEEYFLILLQTH